MLDRVVSNGLVYYRSPLLGRYGFPHAFSTRIGGVSKPPFDTLNFGNWSGAHVQDPEENLQANYRLLQRAIGVGDRRRRWSHLVHGANAVVIEPGTVTGAACKADALVSADPDDVLAVRMADCVAVLVANPEDNTVAVIHAGWRGIVAGVVAQTIAKFAAPGSLAAAIGPCISGPAYPVGEDVVAEIAATFGDAAPIGRDARTATIDLREGVRLQLCRAGLREERIDSTNLCTVRDSHEFFSHRASGGVTGRMVALIGPRRPAVDPRAT